MIKQRIYIHESKIGKYSTFYFCAKLGLWHCCMLDPMLLNENVNEDAMHIVKQSINSALANMLHITFEI
jgi:hypothetical protein